jgi:hypothetical protein
MLELRIGHAFAGDPVPRLPSSFLALESFDASGRRTDVAGAWEVHPAGFLRGYTGDPRLFVYRSKPISHQLPAERFERYLAEEGLQQVIEERARTQTQGALGRERYSRCARALSPALTVHHELPATANQSGGCRLELRVTALEPSAASGPPDSDLADIELEMLFDGAPVEGLLVRHTWRSGSSEPRADSARTDASGRARLPLASGLHLLNVVHAIASEEAGSEWRSFWTSLSFEVATEPAPVLRGEVPTRALAGGN